MSAQIGEAKRGLPRIASDESYVIDLCDEVLSAKALRQHRFAWLVGDPSETGRCVRLPVDAYYPRHRLVIEYRERQHFEPSPFFDRRQTISGVGRGEQRRTYDQRREREIPAHDIQLVVVTPEDLRSNRRGRLTRDLQFDQLALRSILASHRLRHP